MPASGDANEDRVMGESLLQDSGRRRRVASRVRAAALAVLATLSVTALHAQGGRRGLEQRNAAGSGPAGFGTYHAVIFAVGIQQPSSGLPSLRYPLKEADSLRAVITREYTFDERNVQVVKNPTREAILDTLEVLARRLGPDDNLLVVYSGHGGFDEGGREGYWLAADAANARPSTWIPNESVRTWLRKLKARSVLLVTDACFSGSLNRSNDDRVDLGSDSQRMMAGALMYARRTSRQAMTAGTAKETVPQVSIFSMEIVAALKARRAPVFLAQQLASEINPRVAAVAHTTPTFSAVPGIESDQGDFVFVRRQSAASAAAAVAPAAPLPVAAQGSMQRGGAQPVSDLPAANTRPVNTSGTTGAPVRPSAGSTVPAATTSSKVGNLGSAAPPSTAPAAVPAAAPRAAPGCEGGVASGCITQALNLEYSRNGVAQNVPRAVGLYRLACDARDPEGCMHLGRMYDSRHEGLSMDRGKARQLFTQSCDAGSAAACTYIGIATAKGETGSVDAARAAQLFAKACDGGHLQGCGLLGVAYFNGTGAPQNDSRAAALLLRACTANETVACNALGTMQAQGRGGLARDSVKAVGYWRQGCTTAPSIAESCASLGRAYLRGGGVARDDGRAVQYLSQACEGGYAAGCTALAAAYEAGTSVTVKSATRAFEFYKRGCDGGDATGCEWVKAHPQAAPAPPK
ncbi:MAG: SEL1-like repeat protein [Gemmatimonadaceae bacterium]|nr:SEL1-like repeat protein [Gemmatimonadaceae bacterium]